MVDRATLLSVGSDPLTLTRHILQSQRDFPTASGDFTIILSSIQLACKYISNAVRKAGIAQIYGLIGSENVQGEAQKKLDVIANEVFINSLKFSSKIAVMASEEEENVFIVENPSEGKYAIAFDPLDGSSNIDANVSIGSIFAIWKRSDTTSPGSAQDFYRRGDELKAAGYCVYGSSTQLVLAMANSNRVDCYTLDNSIGEFILTHPDLKIPRKGNIYSINEGNSSHWDEAITQYIHSKKFPTQGSSYSLRYVGSMVADVHRTILYGGIFLYPKDKKSPNGKLRILYEVFPMSYIVEKAGGKASTGTQRILDITAEHIHQRSACILGSPEDVEEVEAFYARTS